MRLKDQIDIQPADCCEQCHCDTACCCNSVNASFSDFRDTVLSCVHPQLKLWQSNANSFPDSEETYLMKMNCPQSVAMSMSIVQKCHIARYESDILSPPVFDTRNNITYRNSLCAQCNNRNIDSLVPWNISLECKYVTFKAPKFGSFIEEMINQTNCNFIFYPLDFVMKSKCIRLIDRCNVTGKWAVYDPVIERACHLYMAPYAVSYRNLFCYMCNKEIETANPTEKCVPEQVDPTAGETTLRMLLDLDIVVDDSELSDDIFHEQPGHCVGKALYDSLQERCVTATCMPPKVFLKGGCVNVAKKIGGVIYRMFLVLLPRFTMDNISLTSEVDKIEAYIKAWLDTIDLLTNLGILSIHEHKQTCNDRFLVVHIDLYIEKTYDTLVKQKI